MTTRSGGRLEGKVAIVSGAARGLGECISRLFAQEGASVLLTDIRDDEGEQAAERITEAGGNVAYRRLDVRNVEDWEAAVLDCEAQFGPPSVLVHNAFVFSRPSIADVPLEEWQEGLDVNLTGCFHGFRALLPTMRRHQQGTFVTISSSNGGDIALATNAAYQAAKAGLTALTRHVAVAYAAEGIRANSIHPGPFETPVLVQEGFLEHARAIASGFPIARLGRVEEIAWAAVYLAADESSYVTAATLVVDGGSIATLNAPAL